MENFIYYNPVKIIFGKGEIDKVGEVIKSYGYKKILFTYGGGSIKKNGIYDRVIKQLKNFDFIEFGGIQPNPLYEHLIKAIDIVKKEKIDFILAVGGGSVIDGSKFIAAGAYVDKDPWGILTGEIEVERAIPLGDILTLPATGTEMNGNAVISKEQTKEKLAFSSVHVMPVFSILDPEACYTLPDIQISNGIVDAFVHVMEQYLTYPADGYIQDGFAETILKTLIDIGPKVLKNKSNYNYMSNFMWCTTMALNGLICTGVPEDWSTHNIGHEITALCGIDHGQTLAIVLPGVMSIMRNDKKEKILQYGRNVWGLSNPGEDNIDLIIELTEAFFRSIGIKTRLSEYNIDRSVIDEIVKRFEQRKQNIGEKQNMTPSIIRKILEIRY